MNNVRPPITQPAEPKDENEPSSAPLPLNQNDPEIEILRAENDQLKDSIRMRDAREGLISLLSDAGARTPELLFAAAKEELQFGPEGELQNAAAMVDNLKRSYPDQFGFQRPAASIDAGAGTRSSTEMLSAEGLSKMTPEQIRKLDWADVRRVISQR